MIVSGPALGAGLSKFDAYAVPSQRGNKCVHPDMLVHGDDSGRARIAGSQSHCCQGSGNAGHQERLRSREHNGGSFTVRGAFYFICHCGSTTLQGVNHMRAPIEFTARHSEEQITRTHIAEKILEASYDLETNLIEVYVRRLRQKFEQPNGEPFIRTVRGAGYQLA